MSAAAVPAGWWRGERDAGGRMAARCGLCHRGCLISPGSAGACGVRVCLRDGTLDSPYLGRFAACAIDPIEKKPFRRWQPGTRIYSVGGLGCNATCGFCQNHLLAHPETLRTARQCSPESLLRQIERAGLSAIAYTYHEPTLQAEFILAAAPLFRERGIATAMVTNGLFSEMLCTELGHWVDAANVDVKTFAADNYRQIGGNRDVVVANVERLIASGVHVEITNLVVPGFSDDRDEFAAMVDWIAQMSPKIPLHIARYFPAHRYTAPPTSIALLERFFRIAVQKLDIVYLGNV